MEYASLHRIYFVGVISLISFLAYGPQWLFPSIGGGALSRKQSYLFNVLVANTWISYVRACFTDPGHIPHDWKPRTFQKDTAAGSRQRWCKKCERFKPPRAHHCKVCQRCIPKMDHHCPWTINCVSYRTFPHFIRFLFYSVTAMMYLEYFLYIRLAFIWRNRDLPSYLGPSQTQLALLFIFSVTNSVTVFAVGIMLARNVWIAGSNVTTIEGWEIERHETLVQKARAYGGYVDGPDGVRLKIVKQEFPYDIGIYMNVRQAMGGTILLWLWPFASTPKDTSSVEFETNGFEEPGTLWPPPDPERIPRRQYKSNTLSPFVHSADTSRFDVQAFRQRQRMDILRYAKNDETIPRETVWDTSHREMPADQSQHMTSRFHSGISRSDWHNSEGDTLQDFGVDEEAEEDVPLAEIRARLVNKHNTESCSD